MLNTVTVLTYLITHALDHSDRLALSVVPSKHAIQLRWHDVPPQAHSLAVVVKDISRSKHPYRSVLYNLPIESKGIAFRHHTRINGNYWGVNSWGEKAYHHLMRDKKKVMVSLYVLDKRFSARYKMTGQKLEQHAIGHVIAKKTVVLRNG